MRSYRLLAALGALALTSSLASCDLPSDDGPELFCDDLGYFVCDRGTCLPAECSSDDDCPSNAHCDDATCVPDTSSSESGDDDDGQPSGAFDCGDHGDDELACADHAGCQPTYRGVDCVNPSGEACSGEADCTCASFEFDGCGHLADGAADEAGPSGSSSFDCADHGDDEQACSDHAGCQPSYAGIHCTNPAGDACTGEADCVCESFAFDGCVAE